MKELVRRRASQLLKVVSLGKEFVTPYQSQRGISLVEVIITSAILVTVVGFGSITVSVFISAKNSLFHDIKKYYLAEEGYEVIRFLRDNDWDNISGLTIGQRYSLSLSTSTLIVSTVPEVVESIYTRSFVVGQVHRSASGQIVSATTSGATLDVQAKKVNVDVVDERGTTTLRAIFTNVF